MSSSVDLNKLTSEEWKLIFEKIEVKSPDIKLYYCSVCKKAKTIDKREDIVYRCDASECETTVCRDCSQEEFNFYPERALSPEVLCRKCYKALSE